MNILEPFGFHLVSGSLRYVVMKALVQKKLEVVCSTHVPSFDRCVHSFTILPRNQGALLYSCGRSVMPVIGCFVAT